MRKKMLVMLWVKSPSTQALHKLLQVVLPCFLGMVRQDRERQVVMAILESMNAVIKSCQGEALQAPGILAKTNRVSGCRWADEADDDEQQTEYDAMLQEFSGEGIPEIFYPHQGRAQGGGPVARATAPLPLSAEKSSCTEADRSFSIGTIGEIIGGCGWRQAGSWPAVQSAAAGVSGRSEG
uniref:Uncharacterized protein n=1 Tax=Cyprinus carpio carpio TaxID=630221 RepID=A0A9J8DH75_CYPCA